MNSALMVSERRPLGSWSRFRPWSTFIRAFLKMSEEHRRVRATDDSRVQCIGADGERASNAVVRQLLDELDVMLFERLETKLEFQDYVGRNPFGKFTAVARRKVDEIDGGRVLSVGTSEGVRETFAWDCFLSHSNGDKARVRELKARLAQRGLKAWIDEEQIRPGDRITEKIEAGLTGSRRVVICLSRSFILSRWCRAEYGPFLNDEIARDSTDGTRGEGARVIPLEMEGLDAGEIPALIRDKLRVAYFEPDGWERLVTCLQAP